MTEETNYAKEQAEAQYRSICDMVAALEVDYDRLEALRDEIQNLNEQTADADFDLNRADDDDDLAALTTAADTARGAVAEWLEENGEELKELSDAANDCESQDAAYDRIQEDPLSVEVRSDWHSPGDEEGALPAEFNILLCTGGPAVRIMGELDDNGYPCRAWMEYSDWGTPWTQYFGASQDTLLAYCREFYFSD